jgi:hypothetical protein
VLFPPELILRLGPLLELLLEVRGALGTTLLGALFARVVRIVGAVARRELLLHLLDAQLFGLGVAHEVKVPAQLARPAAEYAGMGPSPPLRIAVKDHFGKSDALVHALALAGHEVVPANVKADILLLDFDPPEFNYRELIDRHKELGAKVWLYPHGAGAQLEYDGLFEPYEQVDGRFVLAPGYVDFLRRIEIDQVAHVIGYPWCDQRPFRPCRQVRNVLFAPTHPSGYGTLADHFAAANRETFAQLLEGPWNVTVRHIGSLEQNALWEADGVEYVPGNFKLSTDDIDRADLVVAGEGTFPTLAIARGVPTIMTSQVKPIMYGIPGETPTKLRRPERYADYIRYPLDVEDAPLAELIEIAAASEEPIAAWKRRWVGKTFDPNRFARLVEQAVRNAEPVEPELEPTRTFTVAGFADEIAERPELLADYVARFTAEDDATLVLWGPGYNERAVLEMTEAAIGAAGIDPNRLPDILLLAGQRSEAALAERASAVLSEWPASGALGALPRLEAVTV